MAIRAPDGANNDDDLTSEMFILESMGFDISPQIHIDYECFEQKNNWSGLFGSSFGAGEGGRICRLRWLAYLIFVNFGTLLHYLGL